MKMKQSELHIAEYSVCGREGYTLSQAVRLWKAKFETIKHFKRDVICHPGLEVLGKFVAEIWEDIEPVTVLEALQEQNVEARRVMFDCIGVSRLFKELEPELLDRQVISKVRTMWNDNNEAHEYRFEDTFELYRLDGNKLFIPRGEWNRFNSVYAVRCWCTSTAREYWIYVPEVVAIDQRWRSKDEQPDAIRAIAWTIRIDVSNPKRIYRQGDIIIVEESEDSVDVEPYHLNKEQYLNLVFSET